MRTIKLSQYAKENAVTYQTVFSWYKKGLLKGVRKLPTGKLVIDVDETYCNNDGSNSSEQLSSMNLIEELVMLTKDCMSKLCELRRALKQS